MNKIVLFLEKNIFTLFTLIFFSILSLWIILIDLERIKFILFILLTGLLISILPFSYRFSKNKPDSYTFVVHIITAFAMSIICVLGFIVFIV